MIGTILTHLVAAGIGATVGVFAGSLGYAAAKGEAIRRLASYDGDPLERVRARMATTLGDLGYEDIEDEARALALIAITEYQDHLIDRTMVDGLPPREKVA